MKTFKSTSGTFSFMDFLSSGQPRSADNDSYTDADEMRSTGIWKVTSSSSSSMYVSNLPQENTYGFLIVLRYETNISFQIFITTDQPVKIYNRIRKSSGWGNWYLTDQTEVSE